MSRSESESECATAGAELVAPAPPQRENSSVSQDSLQKKRAELQSILTRIDPDCDYDTWVAVGDALHYELGPQSGGVLWLTWSKRGSKYDGIESMKKQWNLIKESSRELPVEDRCTINWLRLEWPARFIIETDVELDINPLEWWIEEFIPRGGIGVVYGAPGSGKSFLVLDMVSSIVRGVPWHGREVKKGRVLYIVAEGTGDFQERMQAYCHQTGISQIGLKVLMAAPNLTSTDETDSLIEAIVEAGGIDLIVADTLARVTTGADENSAKDMNLLIANCGRIGKATGATFLLVSHSGKDPTKGIRGSSAINGADDFEIFVRRKNENRTATVTKLRAGPDGAEFAFKLHPVSSDIDGEQGSCVVLPCAGSPPKNAVARRPENQRQAYETLAIEALVGHDMAWDEAVESTAQRLSPAADATRDRRRDRAREALKGLCDKGIAHRDGDLVRLTRRDSTVSDTIL